jgi:hypothetical protein
MTPLRTHFVDGFLDAIIRSSKGLLALLGALLALTALASMAGCTGLYAGKDVETALRQRSLFAWDKDSNFGTDIDGTHTGAFTMAEGQVVLDAEGKVDPATSRVTHYLTYAPKADNAQNSYIQAAQSAERINDRWSQSFDNLAGIIATMAMARNLQPPSAPGQLEQLGGDVRTLIEAEIRKRLGLPTVPIPPPPGGGSPNVPAPPPLLPTPTTTPAGVTQQSLDAFGQKLLQDVIALIEQRIQQAPTPVGPSIDAQLLQFRESLMTDIADLIDRKLADREPEDPVEDATPEPEDNPPPPAEGPPPATSETPEPLDKPLPRRTES